jgi:hypothetical protein
MNLRNYISLGLICVYASSIVFGNLYYKRSVVETNSEETRIEFDFEENFLNWSFVEIPLSKEVKNKLGNGEIKNGLFSSTQSEIQVRYFLGKWDPSNPKQMAVVSHTPDICWVGAGWKPVNLGQPNTTYILPGGTDSVEEINKDIIGIEFQTRVFEHVLSKEKELAMWCTLVDGRPIREPKVLNDSQIFLSKSVFKSVLGSFRNSQLSVHRFYVALLERKAWSGPKSFLRISMPLNRNQWSSEHKTLIEFAQNSLKK